MLAQTARSARACRTEKGQKKPAGHHQPVFESHSVEQVAVELDAVEGVAVEGLGVELGAVGLMTLSSVASPPSTRKGASGWIREGLGPTWHLAGARGLG
jgi:hypothetical protein